MEIDVCPRWLLDKLRIPKQLQPNVAILLSSMLALVISPLLIRVPHFCLMRRFLGSPCPGCGALHSIAALLQLNLGQALTYNPAGIVVAGFFVFQIAARFVAIFIARTRTLVTHLCRCGSMVTLSCLLAVWIHKLILGGINGFYFVS
jgi:hypothetical protein